MISPMLFFLTAMFGNLNSQRKLKALRSNTFTLPEVRYYLLLIEGAV